MLIIAPDTVPYVFDFSFECGLLIYNNDTLQIHQKCGLQYIIYEITSGLQTKQQNLFQKLLTIFIVYTKHSKHNFYIPKFV